MSTTKDRSKVCNKWCGCLFCFIPFIFLTWLGFHEFSPASIKRTSVLSSPPVVMAGYDVVAYFYNVSGCDSLKGKSEYTHIFHSNDQNGISRMYKFEFADENNLNIFKKDPWRYAPRNGGFCSYGTCCERSGWPWAADFLGPPAGPDKGNCGWRIHNGSLYFNIWKLNSSNIKKAENRWKSWFGSLEAGVFNHDCFSSPGYEYMDCVYKNQRYAPATNASNEIYSNSTSSKEEIGFMGISERASIYFIIIESILLFAFLIVLQKYIRILFCENNKYFDFKFVNKSSIEVPDDDYEEEEDDDDNNNNNNDNNEGNTPNSNNNNNTNDSIELGNIENDTNKSQLINKNETEVTTVSV